MKPLLTIPLLLLAALRLFAAATTFTYSLTTGWNLLGCTLDWNTQSRQELAAWHTIALPAGPHHAYRRDASSAAPGDAFWLYNPGDATTLALSGDLPDKPPRFQHGWSFLGVVHSFKRAECPAILHAYEWRGGRFHETNGTLLAGHGYWLYCEEASPTAGTLQATQLNEEGRNTLLLTTNGFTDNTGIAGYHIYLDGALLADADAESLDQWELDLDGAVNGKHELAVVAFDYASNVSARVAITVTIRDLISPTAGALQATQLNEEGHNTLLLTTNGFTDNTGIAGYHIYLDGALLADAYAESLDQWELDLDAAINGKHELAIVAFDYASNVSARVAITVTIKDLIPPTAGIVQASQILQFDRHAVAVTAAGFTDNAAVTAFEVRLGDGAPQSVAKAALEQWPLEFDEHLLGKQTVAVRALDAAGNASAWVQTTVAIQGTTPAYLVIDLSGGPRASSYPVRFEENAPDLSNAVCRTTELWLRRIPAGAFTMGSPSGERGRDDATDQPRHTVAISRPFYLGVFEFTQAQWELVMDYNPSLLPGPLRPVERVTYDMLRGGKTNGAGWPAKGHAVDKGSFLAALRARTSLDFDLPTEAQWEYACRAGTDTALNSGANLAALEQDAALAALAQYHASSTADVGSFAPNAWGLYDMHGNAAEWCLDWTGGTAADATDPVGPATGRTRALRGGNWTSVAARCRSASRAFLAPGLADASGFRIALIP